MEKKTFIFIRNGKEETVLPEVWGWEAVYKDGSRLKQFADDSRFHQVGEIEQDKLFIFAMYNLENPGMRFEILVPAGAKIIHKYKRYCFNNGAERKTIYQFGYKMPGATERFNFILPDGRLVQSEGADVQLA
jgi:hypothetical protein